MAAPRPAVRRRRRSVRVTFSVGLLALGSLAVLVALTGRSPLWLGLGSSVCVALSWVGLRIMWAEVLQSRRENAADRAAAARAYRNLFAVRAAEHAEFSAAMTERLAAAHLANRELEGLLHLARSRADAARGDAALSDLVLWEEQAGEKTTARSARPRELEQA